MTPKSNQGMRSPQLGGIGSRFDVRMLTQVCQHGKPWRLTPGSKVICGVCHPPAAGLNVEWLDAGSGA